MASRDAKRRPLARLSGLGYVTESALSAILKELDRQGALSSSFGGKSRSSIALSVKAGVQEPTCYGPVLQSMKMPQHDGNEFKWEYVHPHAMLNYLAGTESEFGDGIWSCLREFPSSPEAPWKIIWYIDECSPGNLLRVDNTRKCHAVYWAFAEMGRERLSRESNWFLGGVLRSKKCNAIVGGASRVFAELLG